MTFERANHYECLKCGYVRRIENADEYKIYEAEHSAKCSGKLTQAKGDCLEIAFNLAKDKKGLFCFTNIIRDNGLKFVHAWCEIKGYLREDNHGRLIIETIDISGKELKDFALDFSSNNKIALLKDEYYKFIGIKEENVYKFEVKEAKILMNRSEKKKGYKFDWVLKKLK